MAGGSGLARFEWAHAVGAWSFGDESLEPSAPAIGKAAIFGRPAFSCRRGLSSNACILDSWLRRVLGGLAGRIAGSKYPQPASPAPERPVRGLGGRQLDLVRAAALL